MGVRVRISAPLQRMTEGRDEVEADAGTIVSVVKNLDAQFPGIGGLISDGEKVRRFVNVYLNDEDIRFLNGEKTEVRDGDEVFFIPAIEGG